MQMSWRFAESVSVGFLHTLSLLFAFDAWTSLVDYSLKNGERQQDVGISNTGKSYVTYGLSDSP